MSLKLVRANLTYQSYYKKPLLERPEGKASLTQQIYDVLSEHFPISISDIGANNTALAAEAYVNFRLFNGSGLIEIRADHWKGYFPAILSKEDGEQVLRSLNAVAPVVAETSDRLMPARAVIQIATWFRSDQPLDFGKELNDSWKPERQLAPASLGAESISLTWNPTLRNPVEGWDATFFVQPSAVEGSQIFINLQAAYLTGGNYGTLDEQLEHCRTLLVGMAAHLGYEIEPDEAINV